jgi:hypothetical protein
VGLPAHERHRRSSEGPISSSLAGRLAIRAGHKRHAPRRIVAHPGHLRSRIVGRRLAWRHVRPIPRAPLCSLPLAHAERRVRSGMRTPALAERERPQERGIRSRVARDLKSADDPWRHIGAVTCSSGHRGAQDRRLVPKTRGTVCTSHIAFTAKPISPRAVDTPDPVSDREPVAPAGDVVDGGCHAVLLPVQVIVMRYCGRGAPSLHARTGSRSHTPRETGEAWVTVFLSSPGRKDAAPRWCPP